MRNAAKWLVVAVAAAALTACDGITLFGGGGGPDDLAQNLPVFSVDLFEDNIRQAFTNQSVGFSYAIAVNGTLQRADGVGNGVDFPDGLRQMTEFNQMHVASVSKTITTAAILRLIEQTPGIAVTSSIEPWLPPDWTRGPGVANVTFEDLLLHTTGFSFPANQSRFYDADLEQLIRTGVVNVADQVYSNAHHNLVRVMIPYILGAPKLAGEDDETYHARVSGQYIRDNVFVPAGVEFRVTPPNAPNLYYSFPNDELGGIGTDSGWSFQTDFGAYGFYVSAVGIVAILTYVNHTEEILSEEMRETMLQNEYGYWNSRTGDKGRYQLKQGGWSFTTDGVSKGMQSIAGHFPNGVDAAVIINSRANPAFNMASVLRDAYDASFVDP